MTHAHITRQTTPHQATPTLIATPRGSFASLQETPAGAVRGTVLLVPGYTGSKEDFAPILDPMADAGYRVIAIDQRGQYESPGDAAPESYTVAALGADIVSIAETLGTPLHLVGHSFGGLTTRAAVIATPSAFASYTIMSSGPSELPDGPRRSIVEAAEPHLHTMGLAAIYDAGQRSLAADPNWVAPPEPLRTFLRNRFTTGSPHSLQYMGKAMLSEPDRVAELRSTGVPLMVMYGSDDNAWSPAAQSDMALRLGAREVIIDAAVHSPAVEDPAATVSALIRFWTDFPAA